MNDENSLKRTITEAPASQNDAIDDMMDDRSISFFQMMVEFDFDAIRDALIANGWTATPIGGVEYTEIERDIRTGAMIKPPQLRVLPHRGGDGMIMARYQLYDPVFFCQHKEGVTVSGFKQELRPIVDILKTLEQKMMDGGE
jgi:hypothetical protein